MNPLADAIVTPLARRHDPVLTLHDGPGITGRELFETSGRIANVLSGLGLKPGCRVTAHVEKSPQALALYFACLRTGTLFVPLNTAYTPAELEYFIADAEPAVIVCDPDAKTDLAAISEAKRASLLTLDADGRGSLAQACAAATPDFDTVPRAHDDLAAILYTSGTTGRSKGAMLSHGNLVSNTDALVEVWRFTDSDTLLHALPIFHTHGLFVASNVSLRAGGRMVFLPKFDPDSVIENLRQCTAMMGVPTFYTRLLDDPRFDRDLTAHMRLFTSGSAPLPKATHREFHERTGHCILERYGMTETTMSLSNPYDGERRAGSVGIPLPGIETRITGTESGAELIQGETGMLEVRGPNVFKGYWRMPAQTATEFRPDGFFVTGDLARIGKDGYVTIAGRARDLVISGGYNIYPKEVESEIDALEGVTETAVIGAPHRDFGEGVVAVVVRSADSRTTVEDIMDALAGRLARFKHPKRIYFASALPRNSMGKVQKNVLRERYASAFPES